MTTSRVWTVLALLCLLLPLILYSYIGLSSRYVVDDYETAGALQQHGFWGSQLYWYLNWSGRYTYFFLVGLVETLGVQAVPYLTLACLALWMIGLAWMLSEFARAAGASLSRLLAWTGAALLIFFTLRGMPYIHQILFWQTGILTYVAYLVLFSFSAALFTWRLRQPGPAQWAEVAWIAAIAFIIGPLSEISIALQVTLTGFGLAFFMRSRQPRGLSLFAAAFTASLCSFALVALAPGNAVRAARMPAPPGWFDLIRASLSGALLFPLRWLTNHPELAIGAFLLALLAGLYLPMLRLAATEKAARTILLQALAFSALLLFLLIWSGFAIAYYAMSNEPPERAQVIPQLFVTSFLVGWGYVIGSVLHKQGKELLTGQSKRLRWSAHLFAALLLAACLVVGPLYGTLRIATLVEPAQAWAREWDERDVQIRAAVAAGQKNVTVWYIKDPTRIIDYGPDPDFWVNRGAAAYYGLDSIIAVEQP